jgi:HTH-type transcriptional regulator / antitoxin HigA
MGVTTLDPVAYGKLLAAELPKAIETDEEFDRAVERLEALDFRDHRLTPEEEALRDLLAVLVKTYDDQHFEMPDVSPNEMIQFLMDQRSLKQADLVPLLGTRAQVSDVVTGRRSISKAQAKKLATFFHTSTDLFL